MRRRLKLHRVRAQASIQRHPPGGPTRPIGRLYSSCRHTVFGCAPAARAARVLIASPVPCPDARWWRSQIGAGCMEFSMGRLSARLARPGGGLPLMGGARELPVARGPTRSAGGRRFTRSCARWYRPTRRRGTGGVRASPMRGAPGCLTRASSAVVHVDAGPCARLYPARAR